jgi:hypothetical protein
MFKSKDTRTVLHLQRVVKIDMIIIMISCQAEAQQPWMKREVLDAKALMKKEGYKYADIRSVENIGQT